VCFIGLKCYDLIAGAPRPRHYGGAERQQVLLGRGLAARGHQVSFVTTDDGQPDGIQHEGIAVFKAYSPARGLPGLRFVHPRWTGLAAALRRAGADVYYQMGGDSETGQVAAWCRLNRKTFVFSLASDADTETALPLLRSRRQRVLYRMGLRSVHAVIAQTTIQRQRLLETFSIDSVVIRNCTEDPGFGAGRPRVRGATERPRLLWVGRFVPVKRLEAFLDLAAAERAWDFHVVGRGNPDSDYVRALETRARSLPNLTLHGPVSDAALDEQYRAATALVCTSEMEGVPTTFLEAWARGVPVVSTVDPDGMIAANDLGSVTAAGELPAAIHALVARDQEQLARRIREHYLATHTVEAFVGAHEQLFSTLRTPHTATTVAAAGPSSINR
jgi:glycosyltransferase involved in cell wall biosynthesis